MSKFVTYPAVTVLDNDHALLVDSPSAGTNSINAENAGNTLLSKWSGFDTFDEAVQNTISNNQEFIDRDAAIHSETADLKRKIVTTFPAKDASGQIATFESEFEDAPLKSCIVQVEPVQDLHGYDSPWPAGGGKNLIPYPYNGNTESKNGVTVTVNNDGTIVLNGTATSTIYLWLINRTESIPSWVKPSTEYAVSGGNGSFNSNAKIQMILYGSPSWTLTESHRSTPADLSAYTSFAVVVQILEGSTYNNTKIYPQLELGSTATDYAPYSNECPITGFTGCEVQRTGKNIFDGEIESGDYDVTASAGGTKRRNADRMRCANFIPVKPNTTYYSKMPYNNSIVVFYDEKKWMRSNGGFAVTMNTTFTTPSWCKYITFYFNGTEYNNDISINYPSTDHDYHPYTGHTYPITFPSEAGTVYGAYVDVLNGELVPQVELITLDGVVNKITGVLGTTNEGNTCLFSQNIGTRNQYEGSISNIFKFTKVSWNSMPLYSFFGGSGASSTISFVFPPNTTVADANAWLAEQLANGTPVVVTRHIATPIHYPLTPTEIKTLLGTNNIWADTGDVSVEYLMSDVGWYVEKKLRAFQSILAGVEDSAVASKNYSTNSYLIFNDDIYRVTKTITAGETIEDGVNVTKTTVAEQLMALAQV